MERKIRVLVGKLGRDGTTAARRPCATREL